jgi:hemin uptake protein HemP
MANETDPDKDFDPDLDVSKDEQAAAAADAAARMPKIIKFDQLARCGDEIWIECNAQIYRLRRTRQGKLILTK